MRSNGAHSTPEGTDPGQYKAHKMTGTLYLIPNHLGLSDSPADPLAHIIPEQVRQITSQLDYFVVKTPRRRAPS